MTIMEMIRQSGVLTLLGVGTVFGFLITMIICVTLMGKIIHVLGWDKGVQDSTAKKQSTQETTVNHGANVAAITAAVNEYRSKENN